MILLRERGRGFLSVFQIEKKRCALVSIEEDDLNIWDGYDDPMGGESVVL